MSTLALVWDLIAIDNASPAFRKVGAEAETAGGAVGRLAAGLGVAALGAALAVSVKKASDFQAQMVQIKNLTGAAGASVYALKDQVLGLAGKVAQSPTELATGLYHMASIGLKGKDALDAVTVAAKGAAIGHADLEATVNSLTSTIASGIDKGATYSQTMGKLLSIVGEGDMSMSDLNDAMHNGLLPTMAAYGVNLDQTGAALATFGDLNIRGSNAATMLRMAVQSFFKVAQGGGPLLEKIGLSQEKLINDIKAGGLTQALDDLHTHMVDAGMTTKDFGAFLTQVFTKRSGAGLTILMDQIDRYHSKLGAIVKDGDNFQAKWEAVTHTAKFQFKQLEDSLQAVMVKVGTGLLPVLGGIASWIATTGIPKAEAFAVSLGKVFHSDTASGVFGTAKKVFGEIETQVGRIATKVGDLWTQVATSSVAKSAQKIITDFGDGLSAAIQSLGDWGTIALTAIGAIGSVALPILGVVLGVVGEIAKAFAALPGLIRDAVVALAGIAVFRSGMFPGLLGARAIVGSGGTTSGGSGLRGFVGSAVRNTSSAARATGGVLGSYGATFGDARATSLQRSNLFGGPGVGMFAAVRSGAEAAARSVGTAGAALVGFGGTAASTASGGVSGLRTALFGTRQETGLWATSVDGARTKVGLLPATLNGVKTAVSTTRGAMTTFAEGVDGAMIAANEGVSRFASGVTAGADTVRAQFLQMRAATSEYFAQLAEYSTTPAFDSWVPFRTLQAAAGDAAIAIDNLVTGAFVRLQAGASEVVGSVAELGTTLGAGMRGAVTEAGAALAGLPAKAAESMAALNATIRTGVTTAGLAMSTGLGRAWTGMRSAASTVTSEVGASMAGMGAVVGRVGVGALSGLRSAGGSLMSFFGGPWGLGITAAILLLPTLFDWLGKIGKNTETLTTDTKNLTQAIGDNNGAIDANIRKQAYQSLIGAKIGNQKFNLVDSAATVGVDSATVTSAAVGDPAAVAKVKAAYDRAIASSQAQLDALKKQGQSSAWLPGIIQDYKNEEDAILGVTDATHRSIAAAKSQDLAVYGNVKSVGNLKGVIQQMGLTQDATWKGNTATLSAASGAQIQSLKNLGLTVKELPNGSVSVTLNDHASGGIAALKAAIASIPNGKTVMLDAVDKTGKEIAGAFSAFHLIPGHAAGGLVRGAGTGTSDSILRRLSDGEFVVNAAATSANLPLLQKINAGLPAYPGRGVRLAPAAAGGGQQPIVLQLDGEATTALLDGRIVQFATAATNRGRY